MLQFTSGINNDKKISQTVELGTVMDSLPRVGSWTSRSRENRTFWISPIQSQPRAQAHAHVTLWL